MMHNDQRLGFDVTFSDLYQSYRHKRFQSSFEALARNASMLELRVDHV